MSWPSRSWSRTAEDDDLEESSDEREEDLLNLADDEDADLGSDGLDGSM
jgi:hypothetical protein